MLDASRLSATARSVRRERLTYLSPWRLRRLEMALKEVLKENVPGDIAEFGIALGGSAIILSKKASRHGRRFHGFDVFGMIPPPKSAKDDLKARDRYKTIASGESKGIGDDLYYGYRENLYDEVCRSFTKYGLTVDGSMVSLHKGLFENTLPAAGIEKIAFAHIDCDWYDPVTYCLNSLADRITPRGVILIDDYHDYGGCRTATDEFLQARPDFAFEDGGNVILRRTGLNG
ncbi:TylF/MycF/NovP-related O-methyltransferase [Mesorhizobium sp. M00.F.Ca.ET.216.01.1.1]|uniref:TylF/MycF/NovP-related O-methyltransferase n=1 Tax=Mesorhizobium sp. M00.F.Ca.ET.216.01.1.1 TaxID=2500528 RepID=UPI000FD803EB|nr:TylF/MycF/NovP-related O-methyltransferase [Mesorhizobium sp. M00.F.Ca.ET.216.01.1.1]TGQ41986.1 asparagine synthase [Mesorhizobium sp. M00.F.Ca.ET.216.01.1.1]